MSLPTREEIALELEGIKGEPDDYLTRIPNSHYKRFLQAAEHAIEMRETIQDLLDWCAGYALDNETGQWGHDAMKRAEAILAKTQATGEG